jgi:carboxylesterase type B
MSIPSLTMAETTGSAFISKLGVKSIAEARKLSADAVQAATGGGLTFRPVADGYVVSNDLFTLFEQGKFNDTPVLLGHTSDETSAFGGGSSVTPAAFEKQIREQFSSYYVNFAMTGDPNGKGLPPWPAFTDQNQQVMVFDPSPSARTYPILENVRVLDTYFERIRKQK